MDAWYQLAVHGATLSRKGFSVSFRMVRSGSFEATNVARKLAVEQLPLLFDGARSKGRLNFFRH
jgi:hypothetical protein